MSIWSLKEEASADVEKEAIELPSPADLLNRLKAKRKRAKADLADVEAIVELLSTNLNGS